MLMFKLNIIFLIYFITNINYCKSQMDMDRYLLPAWQLIKSFITNVANRNLKSILDNSRKYTGRMQIPFKKSEIFFCDTNGFRSNSPPKSVNKLRPGDIDIIMSMGDSITAGNGAISNNLIHTLMESRGVSWSIGGKNDWRTYWTLPNFLKEYNSNLYGYSTKNVISADRGSKFNVAEPASISDDLLYQAKILNKRLNSDSKVNMRLHWKLLTILNGHNDFCQTICNVPHPDVMLESHKKDVIKTLRYLRDNIPNLIINWVPISNIISIFGSLRGIPDTCIIAQKFECSCLFQSNMPRKQLTLYQNINQKWQQLEYEIVQRSEFHTKNFTINFQPFFLNATIPTDENGKTDLSYFSDDCFHFSQKGHAAVANSLWNNMFQTEGNKQRDWLKYFKKFVCPTKDKPYIATRENYL